MEDLDKNNLQHEKIRLQIDGVIGRMSNLFENINHRFDSQEKISGEILEQTKKTNGRVTKLEARVLEVEDFIKIVQLIMRKKWVVAFVIFGAFKIFELVDLKYVFNKLLTFF